MAVPRLASDGAQRFSMLKNIRLRYDPAADRLVLDMLLQAPEGPGERYVLHLTRRIVAIWRRDLQAMVDASAQLPARMDAAARAVVSQAHHQALAAQVKTRTEPAPTPEEETSRPPRLVTRIACGRRRDDGRWVLQFECAQGPNLGLMLSARTLHGLVDALSRRVLSAEWNLPPMATERKAPDTGREGGSALH